MQFGLFIEPRKPEIENQTSLEEKAILGEPFQLFCNIVGVPDPKIRWYKRGVFIQNDSRIIISTDMKTLDIKYLKLEDDGEYKCVGVNRLGNVVQIIHLKIITGTTKGIYELSKLWKLNLTDFVRFELSYKTTANIRIP